MQAETPSILNASDAQDNFQTTDSSFWKAVFDYSVEAYKSEIARQEVLENKSKFYLSFVTLLLGAVFLNLDFLADVKNIILQGKTAQMTSVLLSSIAVSGLALIFSLIAILISVGLKPYKGIFPKDVTHNFFSPTSTFIEKKDLSTLYETLGIIYTSALEYNKSVNDKKAKWIKIAEICVLLTIISLSLVIYLIGYTVLSQ